MHEMSLMKDLIAKVEGVVREQRGLKAVRVGVRLGALSHISADHFREHFDEAVPGTLAEGAELTVRESADAEDPNAQDILLEEIEIAVADS